METMAAVQRTVNGSYIKSRHDKDGKYPEVLFPYFTTQKPWYTNAEFDLVQEETIPIFKLSHVTHNVEARHIQENNPFTFIPRMKLGKTYVKDGSPLGETYKEVEHNEYQEIPRSKDNPVLPGYWSWWGVDTREWMHRDPDPDEVSLLNKIQENHRGGSYAPGYLGDEVGSPYGNNAFSIKLEDILVDYKQSRPDKEGKEVCLKVGGTLRYRHEICYVVIVCMEGDLAEFPNITGPTPTFDPNGLVEGHGIVVDYSAIPSFSIQSIVKSVRKAVGSGYDHYDWEQLAFSFHFPSEEQRLVCTNVEMSVVKHNQKSGPPCTSTRPNQYGKWVCPNELDLPKKTDLA